MNVLICLFFYFVFIGLSITASADSLSQHDLNDLISGFNDNNELNNDASKIDQLIDGFDEPINHSEHVNLSNDSNEPSQKEHHSELTFDYSGYIKLSSVVNVCHKAPETGYPDHRGLSRFRGESNIKINLRFSKQWKARLSAYAKYDLSYWMNGRDEYTIDVLKNNETENELHETYIQGSLTPNLDIWFGRQLVVWGTSETFRIVDVINPMDNREFGMLDIEDLRLPVILTQINYFVSHWRLSGVITHETRAYKLPAFGNDYYLGNTPLPDEDVPANTFNHTLFAGAIIGRFNGWDVSFHAAKYYKHMPHLAIIPNGDIRLERSILKMIGATLTVVYGNWLIKTELSGNDGHLFFYTPNNKKYSMEGMIGFEYSGFKDTNLSFEIMNQHLFKHEDILLLWPDCMKKNSVQSAFRFTKTFYNEKLSFNALFIMSGTSSQYGALQRVSLKYYWNDAINVMLGSVLYQSGKSYLFEKIKNNDRVFFNIQYNF